jgi:glutathione synthase/RimK-type ligase-like ATP-grasp enzyme
VRYSPTQLQEVLQRHSSVVIKPAIGSGGHGVVKIQKQNGKNYTLHTGLKKMTLNRKNLPLQIKQLIGSRKYIIQQTIQLISYNNRPIDFRILLIKPKNTWIYGGVMGKCARKGKFVTNHGQGGTPMTLQKAINSSQLRNRTRPNTMEKKLQTLGAQVSKTFDQYSTSFRVLGLDVAIDKKAKPWILEVNTYPNYKLFKYHSDKTLYGKIHHTISKIRNKK